MSDPRINLTGPYPFDPTLPRLPSGARERLTQLRHLSAVPWNPPYIGDAGDESDPVPDPVPTPPYQEGEA